MMILHVSFNPAGPYSRTAKLAEGYLAKRMAKEDLHIETLDLVEADLPSIDILAELARRKVSGGIGILAEEEAVWERIQDFSRQFVAAEEVVLSCAMWNFSLPYRMKHYIDVVIQPGLAFRYTASGAEGLCGGKEVTLVTTRGGRYAEPPMSALNFQTPYLRTVLGFIGCNYREVAAEGLDQMTSPQEVEKALDAALECV